jgi:signal transduction histidine kinase
LYQIIQDCIIDVENQSQFKDIDINNEISKNYHIIADKNLLNTIIRNLINNAIKYTPRNGMITISSKKVNMDTLISVKDTGVGMSESDLLNLFKIDKIYSKPGTNMEKGSGLGLILCKEFIEKHGGKIWAESDLEVGSVFKFTIPKIVEMN